MAPWLQTLITILASVIGSSGFWALMMKMGDKKDGRTEMLIGLGHDKIMEKCEKYIERECITQEEYENLYEYLYRPYKKIGGNGSADRMMAEINKLPIVPKGEVKLCKQK